MSLGNEKLLGAVKAAVVLGLGLYAGGVCAENPNSVGLGLVDLVHLNIKIMTVR